MNPNHDHDIDAELPALLADAVHGIAQAPLDEPALERVRFAARQLACAKTQPTDRPEASRRRGHRPRLGKVAMGFATAIVVGLGVWLIGGRPAGESTLYGQVRAATKKVGTIHVVSEVAGPDGALTKAGELWFARGVGFALVSSDLTRIDDGKFLWEYVKGSKFGSRSQSQGPDWMLDQALDVKGELQDHCRRFAEGDKEIGKIPCRCYQVVPPQLPAGVDLGNRGPEQEVFVYISEDSLVRRIETHELTDGKWNVRVVRNWEYDLAVPPETFRPAFGADVEIVDADEAFNRLIDLPTALYVTERSGLVYAVHRAQQFENGGVLLMASVRGTAETLQKFPLQRRMMQPGLYFVDGPATHGRASPQGHGCFHIELAQADHEGINVKWWIVVPRGRPTDGLEVEPGKVIIDFGVVSNGKYAEHLKDANGVRQNVSWSDAIAVPRHEPPLTLTAIAESVYAELAMLRAIKFKRIDLGVRDVNGVPNGRIGTLEDTQSAEFAAAVAEHMKYWERNDVDFQIKQGGAGDFDPVTKQVRTIPGAFLGYYSLVDDDTLKRFAARPEIRIISLRHTRITSAGLAHLKVLGNLEDLDLSETAIDDAGLAHLHEIKSLRRLNVTGTRVTDAGVEKFKAALPGVEVIDGK